MALPVLFLSYSHKDERQKDRLLTQLKVLEAAGLVDLWNDDRIPAGGPWEYEIDRAMAEASVAVLLVSANFLTSDFILRREIPALFERHERAGLTIFPIIAKPYPWQEVGWLARMNIRPKNGRPVWRDGGRYVDRELADIAKEIAAVLKEPRGPGRID